MKRRLTEQTSLFISVIKWFFLAGLIGVIVGLSTTLFLKALEQSIVFMSLYPYHFLLLPFVLFVVSLIAYYFCPKSQDYTTDKVIESINEAKPISFGSILKAFFLPVLTIASGGSAGKEAPCADVGAGLGSIFGSTFRFNDEDRKKLMICGVSAGFASVFGVPISGAIFGLEVLYVGRIFYDALFPSLVSGIVSYQVSSTFGIKYFYRPINLAPIFSQAFFIKVVLAGIFFGLCSFLLVEVLKLSTWLSKKLHIWLPLKGIIGGLVLVLLAFIVSLQYLGLGLETIQNCLEGGKIIWYAFLAKILFTSITLCFGGNGGIVTPIFFIGATSGVLFAEIFKLDIATFSALGLVSLLAGSANTPIAASIMAVELFGTKIAPYAALACVVSFLMTGHRSVYPSQVLGIKKF